METSVYAWLDSNDCIIRLESSIFYNKKDYTLVLDKGNGDRYAHCQSNYFDKPLYDDMGRPNYKCNRKSLVVIELDEDTKKKLYPVEEPEEPLDPTDLLLADIMKENADLKQQALDNEEVASSLILENATIKEQLAENDETLAALMLEMSQIKNKTTTE